MPGGRHLWECDHTPSLRDVVEPSADGNPTWGSPGMSGVGSTASGCSLQLRRGGRVKPLDLRSDGQVAVLYHMVQSSGTATEGSCGGRK